MKKLDPVFIPMLVFPLAMLLFFLLAPLAMVLEASRHYDILSMFSDPFMIHIPSLSYILQNFVFIGHVGNYTVIRITGVSFGTILNSVLTACATTIGATLLGTLIAFVIARYEFPGRAILRALSMVPLLMTPFINAYVIKKIFDWNYGLISWFLNSVLNIPIKFGIDSYAGVVLAQIMTFYPIVYLNAYASLMNIDPSLEEQAQNLGAKGFRLFRSITLPLALPGIAAGAALVFIFSMEDVGAPIIFNCQDYISYQIVSLFQAAYTGQMSPEAAALALVLLLFSIAIFVCIKKYVSLRRYAAIVRGARAPKLRKLGPLGLAGVYLGIFPLVLAMAFPQVGVIIYAFCRNWITSALPQGFTLAHLAKIVADPIVSRAILNSLAYSLAALGLIVAMGVCASYVIARSRIPGVDILDVFVTMPIALPGLVVAVGYFYFFTTFFKGTPLDPITFGPALLLVLAYSVRKLPFTARAVYAGLQQLHEALEEAAMTLGASRLRVLKDIVLPLLLLNIVGGALISFVYCVSEVSVSITLGGLGGLGVNHQAPLTYVMYQYILGPTGPYIVAALGFFLIVIQLAAIVVSNAVFKQRFAVIGV